MTSELKKCVIMQLKKLPYLLRYVPDQCETKKMCNRTILKKWWNTKVCF